LLLNLSLTADIADSNPEGDRCVCPVDYFSEGLANFTGQTVQCIKCPRGAACTERGVTFEELNADEGFWRADNTTLTFYRCLIPAHCARGA
jgi:hypothetical protein